jgi:hypothetical protein
MTEGNVMTTPAAKPSKVSAEPSKVTAIFGILVFIAIIGGCSAAISSNTPADTSSGSADGATSLACSHFRDIASDMSKGILTDAEIRSKMQEVYDSASVAQAAGIPDGAQSLLAAATAGDPTGLAIAISAFSTACSNAGD